MKKEISKVLVIIYMIYIGFSIAETGVDPLIPIISKEIGAGYDIIGLILFATIFFMVVFTFYGGRLSDRYDTKKIIIFSLLSIFTGVLVFGLILTLPLFIVSMIFIRSGLGALDTSAFAYICQVFPKRRSEIFLKINLLWHIGCVIGSLTISGLLYFGINPRVLFTFTAGLFLILGLLFFKIAPAKSALTDKKEKVQAEQSQGFFQSIRYPVIIISGIILFFYAGSLLGLSIWLTTYFASYNIKLFLGSGILSAYWLFTIVGLLITNRLIKKFKEINVLAAGYILGTASLVMIALIPSLYVKIIFLMVAGIGLSCVFPLAKTIPVGENPSASGTVIGFLHLLQGAGIMLFQPVIGEVVEHMGGGSVLFVIMCGQLIGLALTIALFIIIKRKTRETGKNLEMI
jgi:MFS family permease